MQDQLAAALQEADRSALQAGEVRLVLPLDVLEACKKLFRGLRGPPIDAQLRHELELPRHAGGALADMAAGHLQLSFFPSHALPIVLLETINAG